VTLPDGTWVNRLRGFLPELAARPELAQLASAWSVLLHGSTTKGIDDAHSDLDLWALVEPTGLAELDRCSPTRFFGFELAGKKGHLNVEDADLFTSRVRSCDMPLLAELRDAHVLDDTLGLGAGLTAAARQTMPENVRFAWFRFHNVEMRGHHRTVANALARGDAIASLISITEAAAHGLRAALVLDGVPYPYEELRSCTNAELRRIGNYAVVRMWLFLHPATPDVCGCPRSCMVRVDCVDAASPV